MTDPEITNRLARAHVASGAQELRQATTTTDVGAIEEAAEEYLASLDYLQKSMQ